MDQRLEKALEFSNYMTTLNNQRRLLHEKYLENTVHYIHGGKFVVTLELINFFNFLLQRNQDSVVLVDANNTPIEITNISKFLDDILDIYFTNTNEYFAKYNEIKTKRNVEDLLDVWQMAFYYLQIITHKLII